MKSKILAFLLFAAWATAGFAQQTEISKNMSFGFQIGQYQPNFGFGLNVTSPYFAYNYLAVRLRGNLMFNEHLGPEGITWTPYTNLSIGLVGVGGEIGNFMRLYGEGGLLMIFPNSDFSAETFVPGGYGLFGFEFYFFPNGNYFIEIGGAGSGATADKIEHQPIYSNGLLINAGFRFHL